jgi:hypothetical protein
MHLLSAVRRVAVLAGLAVAAPALAQNPPTIPPHLQGVPPPLGPPRPPTSDLTGVMTIEPDTIRRGDEYRSFVIDARRANPYVCRDACLREPQCMAFTYVRPDRRGGAATCQLKSSAPLATADTCCVSGVRSNR